MQLSYLVTLGLGLVATTAVADDKLTVYKGKPVRAIPTTDIFFRDSNSRPELPDSLSRKRRSRSRC